MTLQGHGGQDVRPAGLHHRHRLAISLILSMTLTPVMSTHLLKPPATMATTIPS